MKKISEVKNKQTFAIRKLSVGTTAVLLSSFIYGHSTKVPTVKADIVKSKETNNQNQTISLSTTDVVPVSKQITVDLNANVQAKELIENSTELPANTTYSFKEKVDTSTEGDKAVTVLVNTGSKTIEVNTIVHVNAVEEKPVSDSASTLSSDKSELKLGEESDTNSSKNQTTSNSSNTELKKTTSTLVTDSSTSIFFNPFTETDQKSSTENAQKLYQEYENALKKVNEIKANSVTNPFEGLTSLPEVVTDEQMEQYDKFVAWIQELRSANSQLKSAYNKLPLSYKMLMESKSMDDATVTKYTISGDGWGGYISAHTRIHIVDKSTGKELKSFAGNSDEMRYVGFEGDHWMFRAGPNKWRDTGGHWYVYADLPKIDGYYPDVKDLKDGTYSGDIYHYPTGGYYLTDLKAYNVAGSILATGKREGTMDVTVHYIPYESSKPNQGSPLSTHDIYITQGDALPSSSSFISNYGKLPKNTVSQSGMPKDSNTPGNYPISLQVQYYDTSSAKGGAVLHIAPRTTNADDYQPTTRQLEVWEGDAAPSAQDFITNYNSIPVYSAMYTSSPDTKTTGTKTGKIRVMYKDGSYDDVNVTLNVKKRYDDVSDTKNFKVNYEVNAPNELLQQIANKISGQISNNKVRLTRTASISRTGKHDLKNNTYTWNNWTTASLDAPQLSDISGYSHTNFVKVTLTSNSSTEQTQTAIYDSNIQVGHVIYVDDDNGGKQVKSVEFRGKINETVNTNATVPTNYILAQGQQNITSAKMKNGNNDYIVHLKHETADVTGTDKGAHKTVTRTITVEEPHTGNKVTTQVAYLERQATKDLVTNVVTYGEWHKEGNKPNVLPSFSAPSVAGYTPNKAIVDAITINGNTADNLSEYITYTANPGQQTINYVSGGTTIHTQKIKGVTDQNVAVTSEVPDGWELDNSTVPTSVKINPSDTPINVNIKHIHVKVTHEAPKKAGDAVPGTKQTFPEGLNESDLNKTITRTVTIKAPKQKDQVVVQKIKFYRDADYDAVTHKITYTDWTGTGDLYNASNGLNGRYEFADVETSYIPGYMPVTQSGDNEWAIANNDYKTSKKLVISRRGRESTKITLESNDIQTVIQHVANKRHNTVNIYDDTLNKQIGSFPIEGQTDQTVTFDPLAHLKSGYEFVSGPKSYTFIGDEEDKPITVHVKHGYIYDTKKDLNGNDISNLSRTVQRKIIIVDPHKGNSDKTQAAIFTRTANVDKVTGEISYNPWSNPITLSNVVVPEVAGYTPTQKEIPSLVVNADSKPDDVLVTYVANDGTQTIKYVDINGYKLVSKQIIKGKTDQKVLVKPEIPDGYVLKSVVPDSVTIEPTDTPLIVTVDHLHVHVPGPGKINLPGTTIPGTNRKYPDGVDNDKLSKAMTRIINFVEPTGKESITQRVTFERGADVDAVTGNVVYDDWKPSGTTDTFEEVVSPKVAGYTPSQDKVIAEKPNPNTGKDVTEVTVTYNANDGTQTIRYIDSLNREVVGTTTINGKTDETKDVPTDEVPDGYVLDTELPKTVKINPSDKPIDISVHHLSVKVNPDNPKNPGDTIPGTKSKVFPKGVQDKDLNKTMSRVITLVKPTGKEFITQNVRFERSANVDAVTGTVTYDPWTAVGDTKFARVISPAVLGYEPNPKIVDEKAPNPVTGSDIENVVVNYSPVDSQQTVQYVDKDGNVISTQIVNGKVDQSVPFTPSIPTGWVLDSIVPDTLTIKAIDSPIQIRIKHQIDHVLPNAPTKEVPYDELNKTVTRTIKFKLPDGTEKVIKQSVHFQRDAYYDHVTLETIFGDWKTEDGKDTGIFERVDSPIIAGYNASMAYVPEITVNPTDADSVVEVNYTKQAVAIKAAAPIVQPKNKNVELPQTGSESTEGLALLGLTLTVASLGAIAPRKRN